MEGLLPYVYRAIVQYRYQRIYGALVSPGDSGRFAWESAYIRLPGDSGRFATDIHDILVEALPSPQTLYRRSVSPPSSQSNNGRDVADNRANLVPKVQPHAAGSVSQSTSNVRIPPAAKND